MKESIQNQRLIQIYEKMRQAAELLHDDYMNDPELTSFTALDGEDFIYEGNENLEDGYTGICACLDDKI